MTKVLHINDHNLIVQNSLQDDGAILQRSRGYAWLKGDEVIFDLASDAQNPENNCRLAPQEINTRYWQQCAQTSIGANAAGMRHSADLIWKHLTSLKDNGGWDSLALVVPANYRDSHLQLLLGIAQAVGVKVTTITSKPVYAASVSQGSNLPKRHLDVQLHQTVVTTLSEENGFVKLTDSSINTDVSIQSLQENVLKALQKSFISNDRFDPLHDASTEQQLFDQLFEVVTKVIRNGKAVVGVEHNSQLYSTTLQLGDLEEALAGLIDLIQAQNAHVMVDLNDSFDVSHLSELSSAEISWQGDPEPLDAALLVNASDNLIYKSALPFRAKSKTIKTKSEPKNIQAGQVNDSKDYAATQKQSLKAGNSATHLMQYGLAIPIDEASISIKDAVLTLSRSQAAAELSDLIEVEELDIINDKQRKNLQANDRLMSPLADGVITAIRVE